MMVPVVLRRAQNLERLEKSQIPLASMTAGRSKVRQVKRREIDRFLTRRKNPPFSNLVKWPNQAETCMGIGFVTD